MTAHHDLDAVQKSIDRDGSELGLSIAQTQAHEGIDCPSLARVLSELTRLPPGKATADSESLPLEEQELLFNSLQDALKEAEMRGMDDSASDSALQPSFQRVDAAFGGVRSVLSKLWKCRSHYMVQATETLANGSRNPSWRHPYGQAGVLDFFLELIASEESVDTDLLLHSMRLVGNSCADTDENRTTVVTGNYTAAIIRHLLNPDLIKVVIPVIYNICIDFEPAQTQLATNKIVYILLKLIKDDAFNDNEALLNYAYELIELVSELEQNMESSPDGTVMLLIDLAADKKATSTVAQFSCIATCLTAFLENKRFQDICISKHMVADVLSVLTRSIAMKAEQSSNDDVQTLAQLQLKINQTLAEVSASPLFAESYPIDSSLSKILKLWLGTTDDQLQICSCVMLGNLARSDEVCEVMVRDLKIHHELISILKGEARGAVLHSALGFLKNLAIAGDNKLHLGEAGIIPAISRLWGYETVPQVQFAATSIARQIIISSMENIARLLEAPVIDEDLSTQRQTYLSLLLALFEKTDSTPIKTEIGRLVASICRTTIPKSRVQDQTAQSILERFFSLHEGVALPVGAMIIQSQWPVVRSEGWFALALMASSKPGSEAVVECLQKMDLFALLEETLGAEVADSTGETENIQLTKDRDNTVVLVQELLKNDPDALPASSKSTIQDLMNKHVSQHLKHTKEG